MEKFYRLNFLFKKYIDTECTAEERTEFFKLVANEDCTEPLKNLIHDYVDMNAPGEEISKMRTERLFRTIEKAVNENEELLSLNRDKKRSIKWWSAAAVVFLIFLGSAYLVFNREVSKPLVHHKIVPAKINDIAPGHSGAILTLSNGEKMVIDSAQNGLLALQGKANVVKANGQLVYKSQNNMTNEILYNTMTTAKGRQYQLVLADGSKVWLNAASSITFPTTFNQVERKVEISGEAYFEISKVFKDSDIKEKVPFIVVINSASGIKRQVEVLGTHFNIMAYDNESSVKTTLLEGSVKVLNDGKSVMIKPGEQAVLTSEKLNVVTADVDEAVAWKNGMFSFNDASIEKIMRQVERWYDVEVVYDGAKPEGHYRGEVSMNANASETLKVLEVGGIHFKIDGQKIVVMK